MRPTLPCPGAGLPVLPGIPAPEERGRSRDLGALREFRQRLLWCLTARGDALLDLADAVLCSDRPVTSLVQLSLEPEFRRGHGALYDALAAGRVDDERLFSLLAQVLPPLVDGDEARAWAAGHDVTGYALLDRALSGLPEGQAAQVRDACGRWRRVRVAVDATAYPRPDAWCSPGREHVHNGACHCRGSSKTAPGWEYQLAAVTGLPRTAWAGVVDIRRTTPAARTAPTVAQVKSVLRRLHAAGHVGGAAPLFVFDAGYSAAALTDGLAGCPAHVLVRLPAGSVFYQDAVTWPGKNGRPARRGPEVHCLEQAELAAAAEGRGPKGRKKPLPPTPEPDEALILPGTPLYGTVRAEAWHDVHPQVHGDRGWFAGREKLPVLRGTLVHVTAERLPDGRDPHRQMWLWHAGPGPLSPDELWRAYLARFDIEHAIRTLKGTLGLTAAKVRTPGQADCWARVVIAAHAQLLLARPLTADLRRPWEKHPDPARPLSPGRVRRGSATSAPRSAPPPVSRNPPGPDPAGPKEAARDPRPATFSRAKPTCLAPRTRPRPGKRLKVKPRPCSKRVGLLIF